MLDALAYFNFLLAIAVGCVFSLLFRREKTPFRYVYLASIFLMAYIALIYVHLFVTGFPLGYEYTRPATGLLLTLLLSVGVYDYFRR